MARFLWMESRSGKEIEAPESIGAIIETPGFLPGYSARQNLQFLAGIRRKIGKKEIDEAIRKVGLDPEAKKHVGKYSLGMRQRLGIAQAIMEEPSPDPGRTDERSRQPGRAGDAAAVF